MLIDNTQISNEYATKAYVKAIYNCNVSDSEKNKYQNEYRKYKDSFRTDVFSSLNNRVGDYAFTLKSGSHANLETELTISENNINIENKGKGRQCFIKTEFALKKRGNDKEIDIILIEEPENHLSHINMKKLIHKISNSQDCQIFITTHNSLITSRLDLRKSILLNSNSTKSISLKSLRETTAKFFIKASNNNILEYVLSEKVILVEGDAEFLLMDAFYKSVAGEKPEDSGVHVISVGGTSFKRFLDIAKLLNIKTAVIRDNDGDYKKNIKENFSDYSDNPNIRIFSDENNDRRTFEIVLYKDNQEACNELFSPRRRTLSVQDYMLQNKADVAFELLDKKTNELIPPSYIRNAIEWIKE